MVLDTTIGTTTSESYCSLAEAENFLEQYQNPLWGEASDGEKENALANATEWLDQHYNWYGEIHSDTQILRWPRTANIDDKGRIVPRGTLPNILKFATALMALEFVKEDIFATSSQNIGNIRRIQTMRDSSPQGAVITEFAGSKNADPFLGKRFYQVEALLFSLGKIRDFESFQDNTQSVVRR